jgi:hypothetical protein
MAAYDNPANDNDNAGEDEDIVVESKPLMMREANLEEGKATGSSSSRQLTGSNSSKGLVPLRGTVYTSLANSDGGATTRDGKGVVYTSLATDSKRNSSGSSDQVRFCCFSLCALVPLS